MIARRDEGSWAPPTPAGVADPGPPLFFREAETVIVGQGDGASREKKKHMGSKGPRPLAGVGGAHGVLTERRR